MRRWEPVGGPNGAKPQTAGTLDSRHVMSVQANFVRDRAVPQRKEMLTPRRQTTSGLLLALTISAAWTTGLAAGSQQAKDIPGPAIVVSASNSKDKSKAEYVCDGVDDQEEINAAISALPAEGGSVLLLNGTYDIRKGQERKHPGRGGKEIECVLGGIIIDRSNVCLKGSGWDTKLILADNQSINVIRVIGLGIGNIVIRDLYVDANRDENPRTLVEGVRFEGCGIKVASGLNSSPAPPIHDVTIDSCHVVNAAYLGIMPHGENMEVINNHLANASSDCIEVLGGPATVSNNVVLNREGERSHVGIGTDACNDVLISDNKVVCDGGHYDLAIRIWADTVRTAIKNNQVICKSGRIHNGWDIRGNLTTITGNTTTCVGGSIGEMKITGHTSTLSGNTFENCGQVRIQSDSPELGPIVLKNNHLHNTFVNAVTNNVGVYEDRSDSFANCLPASTDHSGSWAGTGAEQEIGGSITQPDVPRALSVTHSGKKTRPWKSSTVSGDSSAAGYWRFDEGEGTVAADSSSHANHGKIISEDPTWLQGISAAALRLDGTDDYVDCGDGAALNLTSAGTLAIWVNMSAYSMGYPSIAGKGASAGFDTSGYGIWLRKDQRIEGTITNRAEEPTYNTVSFGKPHVGVWHHLGLTWDGKSVRAYLDGVDVGKTTQTLDVPATPHTFKIGAPHDFSGTIDEVSVYSHALTPDEIREHYERGIGGTVTVAGTDSRAEPISETFRVFPNQTAYGSRPFSATSKIAVSPMRCEGDVSLGIADKLGLSGRIFSSGDVYKVQKNDADISTGPVDIPNGTIDFAPVKTGDRFAVWYRSFSRRWASSNSIRITPVAGKEGVIRQTAVPPVVDGRLDEECWQETTTFEDFVSAGSYGEKTGLAKERTTARLVYDGRSLYVAFKCLESNIAGLRANIEEQDGKLEGDDSVGVFLDANHDRQTYYYVFANSAAVCAEKKASYGIREEWNPEIQVKTGVGDDSWVVEMAIPFSELGVNSPRGKTWGVNFVRNHRAGMDDKYRWCSSFWNYPGHKDPHIPHHFGSMRFE